VFDRDALDAIIGGYDLDLESSALIEVIKSAEAE
jgi:hypothetical protein